jgi:hypothetical protein
MLNILDTGQTVKFNTSIYRECDLVRTGIISDGSCFLHAILYATSSKYRAADDNKKRSIVSEFRTTLGESLTKDQWLSLNNGELAKISYSMEFRKLLDELYLDEDKVIKFILNVIPKEDVDVFFEESLRCVDLHYGACKMVERVVSKFQNKLNHLKKYSSKIENLSKILYSIFDELVQKAIKIALDSYKDSLCDASQWLGEEHIELLSIIFNYNIYFFDGRTREPYTFGKRPKEPFEKSLVLLWVQDSHFEVIGKVCDERIIRLLNNNDDFIMAIKYYLNI